LSLGHKQLEENPWDVFETVFNVDSVHKGTVMNIHDKGAIISLACGVEGFAPLRHLVKEDGRPAKIDKALDFKVIEFSKENKKIIVSHAKVHQEATTAAKDKEAGKEKTKAKATTKAVKNIKDNLERTTLGDLGVLAGLREETQESEKQKAMELHQKSEARKKAKAEKNDEETAEANDAPAATEE
jgi:small subunit ribosomal protein S1